MEVAADIEVVTGDVERVDFTVESRGEAIPRIGGAVPGDDVAGGELRGGVESPTEEEEIAGRGGCEDCSFNAKRPESPIPVDVIGIALLCVNRPGKPEERGNTVEEKE